MKRAVNSKILIQTMNEHSTITDQRDTYVIIIIQSFIQQSMKIFLNNISCKAKDTHKQWMLIIKCTRYKG